MPEKEVQKLTKWEAELRDKQTKRIFEYVNTLAQKKFFTKTAFCARCSISKNIWYEEMKKAQEKNHHPLYLILTDRFKLRLMLDILLHIPFLVTHIKTYAEIGIEKNPQVFYCQSTIIFSKIKNSHKKNGQKEENQFISEMRGELIAYFGDQARLLIDSIQSYNELVEKADVLNSLYKEMNKP